MSFAIGIIGVILASALVITMIFLGWHMSVVAVLASLVIMITNRMDIWATFTGPYADTMKNFAGTWFLMFVLGAIFGKIMEDSKAAFTISNKLIKLLGKQRIVLIMLVVTLVLSYGGISLFVIAFTMYPIAMALFKEADLPKKIFPGILLACPVTICMVMMPGTPAVVNLIPTTIFGTDIYAAPKMGIICSVFIFILFYFYFTWEQKKSAARGEHFIADAGDPSFDFNDEEAIKDLPSALASFAPMVVLIVVMFVLKNYVESNFSVVIAMAASNVLALILLGKRLDPRLCLSKGSTNGLDALMITASTIGFGGVVSASPSFQVLVEKLLAMDMPPLMLAILSMYVICGITGSASGGTQIFMNTMGAEMLATGINPQVLHRVLAISSSCFDSMPHASGIVLANSVAKTNYKDTYKYNFVTQVFFPVIATGLALILYKLGIV